MSEPIIINDDNFEEEVLNSDKPVLVDFWADWCGPCKMVAPVLDEIAEEFQEIKVCKLNVDENEEIPSKYGVMSIPTLLYFEEGEETGKIVGYQPKDKIVQELKLTK